MGYSFISGLPDTREGEKMINYIPLSHSISSPIRPIQLIIDSLK